MFKTGHLERPRHQPFAWKNAVDPVGQLVLRAFGQVHHAWRDAQPRQAIVVFARLVDGQQIMGV